MKNIHFLAWLFVLASCVSSGITVVKKGFFEGVPIERVCLFDRKGNELKSVSRYKEKGGQFILHGDSIEWKRVKYEHKREGLYHRYNKGKLVESGKTFKYLELDRRGRL